MKKKKQQKQIAQPGSTVALAELIAQALRENDELKAKVKRSQPPKRPKVLH